MGTLDEAIREHLELKRRAGADPGEVAKQEREAFGPVRREDALTVPPAGAQPPAWDDEDAGPVMPEDVAMQDPTAFDDPLALHDSAEALGGPVSVPFEPTADVPSAPDDLGGAAPGPETELFDPFGVEPAAAAPDPPAAERPRAPAEPLPPAASSPPPPADEDLGGSLRADSLLQDPLGERTVEFSALDHAEAADPQPDVEPVDELEETPEFLEETPEHDRLWFEQKPPRDFDF